MMMTVAASVAATVGATVVDMVEEGAVWTIVVAVAVVDTTTVPRGGGRLNPRVVTMIATGVHLIWVVVEEEEEDVAIALHVVAEEDDTGPVADQDPHHHEVPDIGTVA